MNFDIANLTSKTNAVSTTTNSKTGSFVLDNSEKASKGYQSAITYSGLISKESSRRSSKVTTDN